MNLITLTTPITYKSDATPELPNLRHCLTFLSPHFDGRKIKVIERTEDGALIVDKTRLLVSDASFLSKVGYGILKVIGWMTVILPLLAYIGAKIFLANNVFQEAAPKLTPTENSSTPSTSSVKPVITTQRPSPAMKASSIYVPPVLRTLVIPGTDLVIYLGAETPKEAIPLENPPAHSPLLTPEAPPSLMPITTVPPDDTRSVLFANIESFMPLPSLSSTMAIAPPSHQDFPDDLFEPAPFRGPAAGPAAPPAASAATDSSQLPRLLQHFKPVSLVEAEAIKGIVTTFSTRLGAVNKGDFLNKARLTLAKVHPLLEIWTILTNDELKAKLIAMSKRKTVVSSNWNKFKNPLIAKFEQQKALIHIDHIRAFAHDLKIAPESLIPHFVSGNWANFLDICIGKL